jgi:hypothetical protein
MSEVLKFVWKYLGDEEKLLIRCLTGEDCAEAAARCGFVDILDYIMKKRRVIKNKYFYLHALKGNFADKVFTWIFCSDERRIYFDLQNSGIAIQNLLGLVCKLYNYSMIKLILDYNCIPIPSVAVQMIEHSSIRENLVDLITANSTLPTTKSLKKEISKINNDLYTEDNLKLEVLQMLFSAGCPRHITIINAAAMEGNLDLVQILYYNGFPIDESTTSAAAFKRLDVLVWLRSINCPWSPEICQIANQNPDKTISDYIHSHNPPCCTKTRGLRPRV